MRTGVRVSPSWLGGALRSRIRCSRLIIGALEKSLADGAGHTFFKRLDDPLVLRRMTRPRADVGEAELLQKLADIALVKVDAEPLGDDALEVDRRQRTTPSSSRSGPASTICANSASCSAESRGFGTFRPFIDKPLRTRGVEAMNPVAQRLAVHAADPRAPPLGPFRLEPQPTTEAAGSD